MRCYLFESSIAGYGVFWLIVLFCLFGYCLLIVCYCVCLYWLGFAMPGCGLFGWL